MATKKENELLDRFDRRIASLGRQVQALVDAIRSDAGRSSDRMPVSVHREDAGRVERTQRESLNRLHAIYERELSEADNRNRVLESDLKGAQQQAATAQDRAQKHALRVRELHTEIGNLDAELKAAAHDLDSAKRALSQAELEAQRSKLAHAADQVDMLRQIMEREVDLDRHEVRLGLERLNGERRVFDETRHLLVELNRVHEAQRSDDRDTWRMRAREQRMVRGAEVREHDLDRREWQIDHDRGPVFAFARSVGPVVARRTGRIIAAVVVGWVLLTWLGCGGRPEAAVLIEKRIESGLVRDTMKYRLDNAVDTMMVNRGMNPRCQSCGGVAPSAVPGPAAPIAVRPTEPITAYRVVVCDERFQPGKVAPVCYGKSAGRLDGEFDSDEGIWVKTRFIIPAERLVPGPGEIRRPVEIKRIIFVRRDDGVIRTDTLSSLLEHQDGDNQFRVETPYPGVYTITPVDPGVGQEIPDASVQFRVVAGRAKAIT